MGYLQIEKRDTSWMLKIDGKRVHGVFCESREDLLHWALWRRRHWIGDTGGVPERFIAPLANQAAVDCLRRANQKGAKA